MKCLKIFLIFLLACAFLSACSGEADEQPNSSSDTTASQESSDETPSPSSGASPDSSSAPESSPSPSSGVSADPSSAPESSSALSSNPPPDPSSAPESSLSSSSGVSVNTSSAPESSSAPSSGVSVNPSSAPGSSSAQSSNPPPASSSSSAIPTVPAYYALYISEYVEGNSNNRYIEIYNPNSDACTLEGWSIKQYVDGSSAPARSLDLTGIILANSVYVIAASGAAALPITIDFMPPGTTTAMNFTGNDPVGLFYTGTLIDIVGTPGDASDHIKDMTLVRKPGSGPNAAFDIDEWTPYDQDTLSYLGDHTHSGTGTVLEDLLPPDANVGSNSIFISEYVLGGGNNKYIELYNPNDESFDLSGWSLKQYENNAGSTTYSLSLSGEIPAHSAFVVAAVGADIAVGSLQIPFGMTSPSYSANRTMYYAGGNDPIGLFDKTSLLIDIVGTPGGSNSLAAMTLVRKPDYGPNTVFNKTAEWTEHPNNTFSYLGSHTP